MGLTDRDDLGSVAKDREFPVEPDPMKPLALPVGEPRVCKQAWQGVSCDSQYLESPFTIS